MAADNRKCTHLEVISTQKFQNKDVRILYRTLYVVMEMQAFKSINLYLVIQTKNIGSLEGESPQGFLRAQDPKLS